MKKSTKYIQVELLNGVKCMIAQPIDYWMVDEIHASNAIEGVKLSKKDIIKSLSYREIPFPTYSTTNEISVGDTVYVPVGDSNNNEAKVVEIVEKPAFPVRGIHG